MKKILSIFALLLGLGLGNALAVSATGGTVTNYTLGGTNWTAHIFTNSGTFTVSSGGEVEYLVVGGGGSGGGGQWSSGGGGGAGGLLAGATNVNSSDYAIVVGTAHSNSTALGLTAYRGGNGGTVWNTDTAETGASGGGGSGPNRQGATTNVFGQGNRGGYGAVSGTYDGGGGGGGASDAGGNSAGGSNTGGKGGAGSSNAISGVLTGYAGGGNGGGIDPVGARYGGGTGGPNTAGGNATANTGGGGGGGLTGGNGGSGIVIVRYVAGGVVTVPWRMWQENLLFQENQAIGSGESPQ